VYTEFVKNVTLSADPDLLEKARALARSQHKTLNSLFREWLERLTSQSGSALEFDSLMHKLRYVKPGRRFSRDEMNER